MFIIRLEQCGFMASLEYAESFGICMLVTLDSILKLILHWVTFGEKSLIQSCLFVMLHILKMAHFHF